MFIHNHCGGRIDTKTRTCIRCKRKWNKISFYLSPMSMRLVPGKPKKKAMWSSTHPKHHAKWADRLPIVARFASILPNWPRWARVLSTLVVGSIIVLIILWLVK